MGLNSTPGGSTHIPSCCHWWWSCCCCHCSGSFYTDNVVAPSPTGSIPDYSALAAGSSSLPTDPANAANSSDFNTGQLHLFSTPFGATAAVATPAPAEPVAPPEDSANTTLYSNQLDKECLLTSTGNHVTHETDPKPYQENYDYRAYREPELAYESELEPPLHRERGDCDSYTEGMSGTDSYEGPGGGPPGGSYLGSYHRIRHLSGLSEGGPYPVPPYSMGPYPSGYRSGESPYSDSQYGGSPDRRGEEFGRRPRGEMEPRYSEYEMQRTLQRGEAKSVAGILKRPPGGPSGGGASQEDTNEDESAYNEHFKHSDQRAGTGEYRVPSVRVRPVQARYSSSSPVPGYSGPNGPIVTQPEPIGNLANGKKSPFLEREVSLPRELTGSWDSPGQPRLGEEGGGEGRQERGLAAVVGEGPQGQMIPPLDRWNLMYLTLVLHGVGTLMPWNIFINAKTVSYAGLSRGDWQYLLPDYFVHYKLGREYTHAEASILPFFLQYLALAAQLPNVLFNWVNVFLQLRGSLTPRIVWTLLVEILVLILTIVLAMVETASWPTLFFYLTLGSVVLLSMANGVYQNTVYGLAARLPFRYTGAVVLGSNLSGTIVALINLLCISLSPNPRTAAIYYFITALFMLLACFDTYFALPLNRFYRYHEHLHAQSVLESQKSVILATSYWDIARQCGPQLLNIFLVFAVTLSVFPAVLSDVDRVYSSFFISREYFVSVTCFLTFNLCAVIGNLLPSWLAWPSPGKLFIPAVGRLGFIPLFLLCNYRPQGVERLWPVLFHWDGLYWSLVILFGISGGYTASLALCYCPRSVGAEYASIAGMMGAAAIGVGVLAGLAISCLMPLLVSVPALDWELPGFWPAYHP